MTRTTTTALVLTALFAQPALADDLTPPPWRSGPGTTYAHWDFSAGAVGGAPDAPAPNLFNPYGTPNLVSPNPANYLPALGPRNNVWAVNFPDALQFDIPNTGVQSHQKEIWVQVTHLNATGAPLSPLLTVAGTSGPFTLSGGPFITATSDGWTHELTIWTNPVCPVFERIAISPPVPGTTLFIDQVVIDTQCAVPGPGATALLACAGLLAIRRRRA